MREYSAKQFYLRWLNTAFVRALADAIQLTHKDCENKHAVDTVIILCTCHRLLEGGGGPRADVGEYGDFMGTLQQISALVVGEMWGL